MTELKLKHWKLEKDANGFLWCHLDRQGQSTNVLSAAVLTEFNEILNSVETSQPAGMVICSDKTNGFIAGADVEEFTHITDRQEALDLITNVHAMFNRLEELPFPTLALINGFCLGGGLELALACDYRVALDAPGTRIGLPEVLLGIHPGFGGSMRSIRNIGVFSAMPLMLAGRTVDARQAKKLGLIDAAVPLRQLHNAATGLLLKRPRRRRAKWLQRVPGLPGLASLVALFMRRRLKKRVNEAHYPAPYALVDLWERTAGNNRQMLNEEAESVATLIVTDTSRNLVRLFMLQERIKAAAKNPEFKPAHVHVIGAGVMGGDIAAWCAVKGMTVTLQDREPRFIAPAIKRAHALFKKRLKVPHLVTAAMDRLVPDVNGYGIGRADVVIEAIIEDLQAKSELFKDIEQRAGDHAVLATNTSSIPLDDISNGLQQPGRLVGIHFFNPVAKMQLVEIVHSPVTTPEWITRAAAFCRVIDRLPLPVTSSPGFLINRILTPYLLEMVAMLEEGIPAELIDDCATGFGMPVGPVELADTVGLDICLHVARNMMSTLKITIPERFEQLVSAGKLGRKSGQGFYTYRKGKPVKSRAHQAEQPPADLEDRLIMRILNESAACLREGIVEDADLLDAGMVYGTGFAPFRGGPMHYASQEGIDDIIDRLLALEIQHGDRFKPDPGWKDVTSGDE